MNWGWKIAIGYSAFVVFMLFMVFMACCENFELVTPDYYNKEIAFQQQIDKAVNAREAGEILEVEMAEDVVIVYYPNFEKYADLSGSVSFFRPSDGALDRDFELNLDAEGKMLLSKSHFKNGRYVFKADWVGDGTPFYIERQIDIR